MTFRIIPSSLIYLLFTLLLSFNALAAETGQVTYPYMGLQFTLPAGWSGQTQAGGYFIQSPENTGFMLLFENNARKTEQLKKQMTSGLSQQNIHLSRSSSVETFSTKSKTKKGVVAEFSGDIDGTKAKAYIISLLNPDGPGLSIVAAATSKNYTNKYKKLATQIANSVVFSAPQVDTPDKTNAHGSLIRKWQQWLQNARLSSINEHKNKISKDKNIRQRNKKVYDLCSNHRFYYYHNTRSSIDTDSGFAFSSSNNFTRGRWYLTTRAKNVTLLNLQYENGHTDALPLTYKTGNVLLNQTAYAYSHSRNCH